MTIPDKGLVDEPVNFTMQPNRGDRDKTKTVEVSVKGHGDHKATDRVTYTQEAPEAPVNVPSMGYNPTIEADATSFSLDISNLSHIYEVRVTGRNAVDGSGMLGFIDPPSTFTIDPGDNTRASATFKITKNTGHVPLKTQVVVQATGNRQSQFYTRHYTVTQKAKGRPGSITATPASFTKGPEAEDFHEAITVNYTNIPVITVSANASWIKPTYSNNRVSFSLEKNTGYRNRTGTITVGGTDESGERREATVSITQTAYTPGLIIIPPRDEKISMWGNDSPSPGKPGKSEHFEGVFGLENMPAGATLSITASEAWIRDLKVEGGKYLFKLSNNSGGKERTGTITISGQDKAGNTVKGTVQVTQKWGTSLSVPERIRLESSELSVQISLINTADFNLKASINEPEYKEKIILSNQAKTVYLSLSPKEIGNMRGDFGKDSSFRLSHTLGFPPKRFNLAIHYIDSDGNEQYKQIQVNP